MPDTIQSRGYETCSEIFPAPELVPFGCALVNLKLLGILEIDCKCGVMFSGVIDFQVGSDRRCGAECKLLLEWQRIM